MEKINFIDELQTNLGKIKEMLEYNRIFTTHPTVGVQDLNEMREPGCYIVQGIGSNRNPNLPPGSSAYGVVLVLLDIKNPENRINQLFLEVTSGNGKRKIYNRSYASGTWYPWLTFTGVPLE